MPRRWLSLDCWSLHRVWRLAPLGLVLWGSPTMPHASAQPATPAAKNAVAETAFEMADSPPEVAGRPKGDAKPDGAVELTFTSLRNPGAEVDRPEDVQPGYYLAIVTELKPDRGEPDEATLMLMRIEKVNAKTAQAKVSKQSAAKVSSKHTIIFFRPPGVTSDELKKFPPAPLPFGIKERDETREGGDEAALAMNRLKQIGLAIHNFHDVYGKLPARVLHGPDGKPWHSWRTLILPFVEEQSLFDQYRWDEPWDGPNNSKLLDQMPAVYHNPLYAEKSKRYTSFAAVAGEGLGLSTPKVEVDSQEQGAKAWQKDIARWLGIVNFTDGTSNTLLIGSVSPEQKIAWTQPEDIAVTADAPVLGKKPGFDTPLPDGERRQALFVFADGSVSPIPADLSHELFFKLSTRSGGEVVDRFESLPAPPRQSMGMFLVVKPDANGKPEAYFARRIKPAGDKPKE